MIKIFFTLLLTTGVVYGQETVALYNAERFAFQVKQIEEFIERFNNTDKTLIKQYLRTHYQQEVSREDLVLSLFDHADREWKEEETRQFLEEVVDNNEPPYLSFYDHDWYAKVICQANYLGQNTSFDLVMGVITNPEDSTVNWEVRSLHADFMDAHEEVHFSTLLPPNGHGTNFLGLRRIFMDPLHYVDSTRSENNAMNRLLQLAQRDALEFTGVKAVSYHFLQLHHWIIRVEEFDRKEANNGWLISDLIPADAEEKQAYRHQQLYLDPSQ